MDGPFLISVGARARTWPGRASGRARDEDHASAGLDAGRGTRPALTRWAAAGEQPAAALAALMLSRFARNDRRRTRRQPLWRHRTLAREAGLETVPDLETGMRDRAAESSEDDQWAATAARSASGTDRCRTNWGAATTTTPTRTCWVVVSPSATGGTELRRHGPMKAQTPLSLRCFSWARTVAES